VTRRQRAAAAVALGAATVTAFAPVDLPHLAPLCLAAVFALWAKAETPRRAAGFGFLFGLAFFGTGVSWVYVSLHDFGMMPAALAALATAFFCAYLSLFPALAASLQARLVIHPALRALLLAPALWVLCEWMRGWLFTGFPWIAIGYSQVDTALSGYGAVAGVYGVSLALALCAGSIAASALCRTTRARIAVLSVAVAVYAGGGKLKEEVWVAPSGEPITVALVQGNIAQNLKFDPVRYQDTLQTYRRLVESASARLIVLPETAIPRFLDFVDPAYLDGLAAHARSAQGDVLIGVPFRDGRGNYYNGVVSMGSDPLQFYAKRHLVPLGEFVPPEFRWIVATMNIPLSDFARGTSTRPLRAVGQRLGMTVCYEDVFGEETIAQLPEATMLVNVSNVAWFGDSLAPPQHLQMSRLRSIETGRYMLRATNTGVTAIVDQRGEVVVALPKFTEGVLVGRAQGFEGATPYVRHGNWPVLALCVLALVLVTLWTLLAGRIPRSLRP
jgi:apolipoprotein N-acyltransferase